MNLGSQLRDARIAAGLTIAEVAERAGFSSSYISQVERDLANPSVGAVNRIAEAVGIRMRALFSTNNGAAETEDTPAPAPEKTPTRIVKYGRRKKLTYPGSNVVFSLLCPDLQHDMEVLSSTAPEGTEMGDTPVAHPGEECAVVLKGTMELTVAEERYVVEAGDSIYFDSGKLHHWKNVGSTELEVFWVITPPHF
jgi:transcriptional regulator with XRE-family HTH domain